MRVGIIIQARMSSERLPGKVMKPLAGRPVLWHVVERCRHSRETQEIVVATSDTPSDDAIYDFCLAHDIKAWRGSLGNVLERYYGCARAYGFDVIVRVTADCPLIDPGIIDDSIKLFLSSRVDYVSNTLKRNFPRGLDCEVFSFSALTEAFSQELSPYDQEHVTPYIIKHKQTLVYPVAGDWQGEGSLTLDTEADYDLLSRLYDRFYQDGSIIDVRQVIKYINEKNVRP